jgi:hypothetical protein
LPTAQVIAENTDGSVTITAESYSGGIDMRLGMQGDWIGKIG